MGLFNRYNKDIVACILSSGRYACVYSLQHIIDHNHRFHAKIRSACFYSRKLLTTPRRPLISHLNKLALSEKLLVGIIRVLVVKREGAGSQEILRSLKAFSNTS